MTEPDERKFGLDVVLSLATDANLSGHYSRFVELIEHMIDYALLGPRHDPNGISLNMGVLKTVWPVCKKVLFEKFPMLLEITKDYKAYCAQELSNNSQMRIPSSALSVTGWKR